MLIGAIDTSCGFSLAVYDQARQLVLIDYGRPPVSPADSRKLAWTVKQLLAEHELHAAMISRWIVGTGPGSFTGIRTGIALVSGICIQTAAEYCGQPSSLAVAASLAETLPTGSLMAVLNDARQGQLIVTKYRHTKTGMELEQAARVVDQSEIASELEGCSGWTSLQSPTISPRLPRELAEQLVPQQVVEVTAWFTIASWPAEPARRAASLEPVYVRPPVFVEPVIPADQPETDLA